MYARTEPSRQLKNAPIRERTILLINDVFTASHAWEKLNAMFSPKRLALGSANMFVIISSFDFSELITVIESDKNENSVAAITMTHITI